MTRSEAAKICQSIKFILENSDYTEAVEEALDMAIAALKQLSLPKIIIRQGEQEPTAEYSSDVISRQAAIDEAKEWIDAVYFEENDKRERKAIECFIGSLKNMPSSQPEQRWIPCSEGLPEDLEEVNVTWVNHDPEPYYDFVKDKPFTATAVYYKEKWYWYSSTCADILAEYGRNPNEEIDDGIEIIAWMPLPEPYKGEES